MAATARARYLRTTDGAALYRVTVEAEDVTTETLDGAAVELVLQVAREGCAIEVTDAEGLRYEAGVDGRTAIAGEAFTVAGLPEVAAAVRLAVAAEDRQRARAVAVRGRRIMEG